MPMRRSLSLALTAALIAATAGPAPVAAASEPMPSGAYLAARQASRVSDYANARRYFAEALAQDPANAALMENALVAFVGLGDIERGLPIARRLAEAEGAGQLAGLVLMADDARRGEYAEIVAAFEAGESFSPLIDGLAEGWALFGLGRMSDAADAFDRMSDNQAMEVFGLYHKALALAAVGDFEGADAILAGDERGPIRLSRGALVAHAQILSQLERGPEAVEILDTALGGGTDTEIEALRDRIAAGEAVPYDFVTDAREGMAETFHALSAALEGEAADSHTLIYARLAEYLRPGNADILLLVAELLEAQERYDLAVEVYAEVPPDDPAYHSAEIGRAEALYDAGREDEALAALEALARSHGQIAAVHMARGDLLRRMERYGEATGAYDAAIALLPQPPQPNQWFLYYARGITHEREDRWESAEVDFRQALELSPDQPLVLNYLGYSLVEKRMKLDEALDMIERAVRRRPNDGYITDSLGWVLYRLGRFDEAVPHMERAVELMPVDPIINDHLGDVYWMVDRRLEAEFQWKRALSFDPEPEEAERIRRKLDVGLDRVLADEGELDLTENGN